MKAKTVYIEVHVENVDEIHVAYEKDDRGAPHRILSTLHWRDIEWLRDKKQYKIVLVDSNNYLY